MNCLTQYENGIITDADFYNRLQYADTASVLLLSDTHGAVDAVRWILSAFSEKCQACLFAGDGAQDMITVVREAAAGRISIPPVIIMTQGNCDSQLYPPALPNTDNPKPFGLPVYQQRTIARQHILLTHGHLYHVELDGRKLSMAAENLGCTIAVHGHTHIQSIESFGGVTAINPCVPAGNLTAASRFSLSITRLGGCNFIGLYGKITALFPQPYTRSILFLHSTLLQK